MTTHSAASVAQPSTQPVPRPPILSVPRASALDSFDFVPVDPKDPSDNKSTSSSLSVFQSLPRVQNGQGNNAGDQGSSNVMHPFQSMPEVLDEQDVNAAVNGVVTGSALISELDSIDIWSTGEEFIF